MIIAGADMAVADQRSALAPHHHRKLRVGLQFDEAEHDLRAGALEVARPANIRLLVEARLELDQRGHRLARFRRLDERAHDRTVGRRAIERLLDRDDIGIVRRLVEELHDDVERFVRMMDDEILLPDRGEAIAAVLAHPFGEARVIGREFELRTIDRDELRQFVERQHAFDQHHARRHDVDVAGDEGAQRLGHARLDLQADDDAAPSALQRAFVKTDEILGLFLDLDVAVADDAKPAATEHRDSRETASR